MAYSAPTEAQNQAALDYFIQLPVSKEMIKYLASTASQVIRCSPATQLNKDLPPTPPATPSQGVTPQFVRDSSLPSVEAFITNIVKRSHVRVPTLMTSLVYIARLKARLPPAAKGMPCTVHRIFLAALILAAKNLNDSSPKNSHWARYTAVKGYDGFGFSYTEVNSMERQLLGMLNFDLRINPEDLYTNLEPFLAPIRAHQAREAEKVRAEQAQREQQLLQQQAEYERAARLDTNSLYASPYAYSTTSVYSQPARRGYHSRAPSRTPSLSPPSRSSTSSANSVSSSPPTSIMEPYPAEEPEMAAYSTYDVEAGAHVVHVLGASASAGNKLPLQDPYGKAPSAKRKRTNTGASNIFSRVFGTGRVAAN